MDKKTAELAENCMNNMMTITVMNMAKMIKMFGIPFDDGCEMMIRVLHKYAAKVRGGNVVSHAEVDAMKKEE